MDLPSDVAAAVRLGGECGSHFEALDWDHHPLGPPRHWPEAMRTIVSTCLASRFPVVLWLGDDLTMVYNDGYIPMLADKHPWAMGTPGLEVWSEIRDIIEPMLRGVVQTGVATWSDDLLLMLVDQGRPREKYFTFTYSPIFLPSGTVGGVFCAVAETTDRVLSERRLVALNALGAALVDARSVEETVAATTRLSADQPADLPFLAVYLAHPASGQANLRGASPPVAHLLADTAPTLAFWTDEPTPTGSVVDLTTRVPALPTAFPAGGPESAIVLPLSDPTSATSVGALVIGLNPNRPLDEQYQGFCRLLADQVAAGIADARAFEAERARAESLAELDRAKTLFLTNVSHELRTPLTLMLGPLEDALALVGDNAVVEEHLHVVHRSAQRLLRLVSSLLEFARIEAGRASAQLVEADVGAVTAEIASSFADVCRRAGLELVIDCQPAVGRVDLEMWETVVLNLLSNAFKFTLSGSITVTTQVVDDAVHVSVSDTGVGIPEAEQELVFDRFYRPSRGEGRSIEGSGIGLALVQNLVELHGGSVGVESTPGAGTTFTVTLPRAAPLPDVGATTSPPRRHKDSVYVTEAFQWLDAGAADLRVTASEEGPSGAGMSRPIVLVADDNADLRDHVARVIGSRWSVVTAPDGERALELARHFEPDLVIADVMMPKLDGFELIRAIRADPRLESIPVMVLSARAGVEASADGFSVGADDYLVKPFRSGDLLNRVAARLKVATRDRERREREQAEVARSSRLAELGRSLSAAATVDELAQAIFDCLPGLHSVGLGVTEARGDLLQMSYAGKLDATLANRYHAISLDAPVPVARVARSGDPMVISDVLGLEREFHAVVADTAAGVRSALVQPLRPADGEGAGALVMTWSEPRSFTQADIDLSAEVAQMTVVALERVQRAERERKVAAALQERLLDWSAHTPTAAIWATYQPASDSMRVGGDWYTITDLDDKGCVGISVGDVVGHGLPAATVMSELRSALAMGALALHEPRQVLTLLENYARHVPGGSCTTAAYVLVDPGSATIRYGCAGHPPPVLAHPDGHVALLEDGWRSALAVSTDRTGTEGEAPFGPGSLLVLYTDGLIERRGESLDVGLARLADAVRSVAVRPVGAVCTELLAALAGPDGFQDDVALVAVRPRGATAASYIDAFPAQLTEVGPARRRFRSWLQGCAVDEGTLYRVLLTSSEAITNAIEHGSRSDPGAVVTLEAFPSEDEISATVTDSGRWDADSADSRRLGSRGRGLALMHGMSEAVEVHRSPQGTRVTLRHQRRPVREPT